MSTGPEPQHVLIDASVAVQWYLPEAQSTEAERLLDDRFIRHAPDLLYLEVANVLWKRCHQRGELMPEHVAAIRDRLDAVPIEVHPTRDVLDDAVTLALETGRTVYDCVYLASAIRLNCPLVTSDRRLVNALASGPRSSSVHWVGDPL